jgi:hypothetical protein
MTQGAVKMKRVFGVVLLGVSAVFFLVQGAVAQVSITLTGPPPGNTYDGIYMSPYYATVGGSTNVPVICDDFGDDTSIGDHWTATASAFPTSSGPLSTSWGLAGKTTAQYDEVAWLALQLLSLPSSVQPANALTLQVEDSFALWAVFDPTGVASYLNSNYLSTNAALCADIFGSAGCTSSWVPKDGGLLASAYYAPVPSGGYSMEVLSPDSGGSVCTAGKGVCPAQEFIAMVPEGGAAIAYLFLAGLCCFGAIYTRSRRQVSSTEAA